MNNIIQFLKSLLRKKSSDEWKFVLPFTRGNIARFFYFNRMLDKVSGVSGDVVECGVGKSKSFQMLALLLQNRREVRKLWGFDSFEGFPEPSPSDFSPRNPRRGEWKKMAVDQVYKTLSLIGLDDQRTNFHIEIIKGFFKESLPKTKDKISEIALLHLDVDLYESYKICLEELFPKVSRGGGGYYLMNICIKMKMLNFREQKKLLTSIFRIPIIRFPAIRFTESIL